MTIGKVSSERDQPDGGGGEEFPDDGAPGGDREGAQQLDGAGPLFVGPEFHADGRGEQHEDPRVPEEERPFQRGVADAHEVAEAEGQSHRQGRKMTMIA